MRKIPFVASDDRSWGHRPIWRYLLIGVGLLFVGWIAWKLFESRGVVGDTCDGNVDCRSRLCLSESGRLIRYCTEMCDSNAVCPEGWKCIASPDVSYRQVCVRP